MEKCDKPVPDTNLLCGQKHGVYCSDKCAKEVGAAELAELGITPEMMKEALDGYYECRGMIEQREKAVGQRGLVSRPAPQPQNPYVSDRE